MTPRRRQSSSSQTGRRPGTHISAPDETAGTSADRSGRQRRRPTIVQRSSIFPEPVVMRHLARSLMLLAMLGACAPDTRSDAERSADAARADSSAAGYDVGPARNGQQHASRGRRGSAPLDSVAGRDSSATRPSGAGPAVPLPMDTGRSTPIITAAGPGPGSGVSSASDSSGSRATGPSRASRDSAAFALPALSPELEASYLVFDSTKRTATFQLAAGGELPQQVSFNGARRGTRTLTIPLGWRVTVAFANRDPDLPHSATIVAMTAVIPEQLPEPAFPPAHTVRVAEGLLEGDSDEISFVAERAGRYMLACGVLGHAQRGQWIAMDISPTAAIPRYR